MTPEQLQRLERVEAWMKQRQAQQITFPLDQKSIEILNGHFMRITGDLQSFGVGGDIDFSFIGKQADKEFLVGRNQFIPYVVDLSSDRIIPAIPGELEEDRKLYFITDDTFPGGISPASDYYVLNPTAEGFQIASSPGGSPINLTTIGVGRQWFWSYGF